MAKLTMAKLTMAKLTMAKLTMAIFTMAILTTAHMAGCPARRGCSPDSDVSITTSSSALCKVV